MKILLVSPFIDPQAVGEPRWCHDLAKALSERLDTIVVSQTPGNRDYRVADLLPNAEVHETPPWKLDVLGKRMNALAKPNYIKFFAFAEQVIKHRLDRPAITAAHHFGPLGMRYPTPLRGAGIPYVLGPVGGSLPLPSGFRTGETKDPWYYKLRDIDGFRFRHDPLLRASYRNAACVVGAGGYVRDVLAAIPLQRFATHAESAAALPAEDVDAVVAARAARGGPVRFLVACRLVFSKGVQYALRALASAGSGMPGWRLDILGDGVYRGELERLAAELGIAGHVTFHGHVPRAAVDGFYRDADVFLFPTIREPSGVVIFEAIGWGLPLIVANYGGPATHVQDGFGIRVSPASEEAFVAGMAEAIGRLGRDPSLRAEMGRGALHAARERHGMTEMVGFFEGLYRDIARPGTI